MELYLYPDEAFSLNEIFSVIVLSGKQLNVRLIGNSSDKTNNELITYYQNIRSNDPNTELSKMFIPALKNTSLYKELASQLKKEGYALESISYEKLGPSSIPDVYLKFVRNHY